MLPVLMAVQVWTGMPAQLLIRRVCQLILTGLLFFWVFLAQQHQQQMNSPVLESYWFIDLYFLEGFSQLISAHGLMEADYVSSSCMTHRMKIQRHE